MKPGVMTSQHRWEVLRVLAEHQGGSLTLRDMAEKTGIAYSSVRECLTRPIRCGWVAVEVPTQRGWGPMPRQQYQITDKGLQVLGSLTTEE